MKARRTQHYGYAYSSQRTAKGFVASRAQKTVDPLLVVGLYQKALPNYIKRYFPIEVDKFNQIIINEYLKDGSIGAHIDDTSFGPVVCSLSLISGCNMILSKGEERHKIWLPARSLLILTDEARYDYTHEIKKNITMEDDKGNIIKRGEDYRRISLTLRSLKL